MSNRPSKKRKRVVTTGTPAQTQAPATSVDAVVAEPPVVAEPEPAPPKTIPASPVSRYRGLIVGVAIAFVALVVVLLVSINASGAKPAATTAEATVGAAAADVFAGINRSDVTALMQRGKDLYDQGRFEDAATVYKEVIKLKPDNQAAQSNLGSAYFRLQRLDEALAAFREAVRLSPNDAEALQNLGAGLAAQGSYDEAIKQYVQAVALKPDLAPAHYSLGVLYQEQNNKDQAIAELKRYLAIGTDGQLRADAQQRLQALGAQ